MMTEKVKTTNRGNIHYWINDKKDNNITLVLLPGLTADHRLFAQQVSHFENEYQVFVWDAPAHGKSRPFEYTFSIMEKAEYLHEIFRDEKIDKPIIIGQSMGGYVGQAFVEKYPEDLVGLILIDSAPLQRKYVTAAEIWLLKRMEPVYRAYPWKTLLKSGVNGTAYSEYGQKLIYQIWSGYDKYEFSKLSGHGYRILAEAMEADLAYEIKCPALLICGEHDKAGSVQRYNRKWTENTGIPLVWIPDAGHNSNTDNPDFVNREIEKFLSAIK